MPEEKPVVTVDKKVANNGEYAEEKVKSRKTEAQTIHKDSNIKQKIIISKTFANGVKKNSLGALIKNGRVLANYALTKKELESVK